MRIVIVDRDLGDESLKPSPPLVKEPTEKKTLYWWQAIDDAEERGGFTPEQVNLSHSWVTCACGQQDPRIPRKSYPGQGGDQCPEDADLAELGISFFSHVRDNDYDAARITLSAIEQRSAEILASLEGQS